jgi:hypothetical protein
MGVPLLPPAQARLLVLVLWLPLPPGLASPTRHRRSWTLATLPPAQSLLQRWCYGGRARPPETALALPRQTRPPLQPPLLPRPSAPLTQLRLQRGLKPRPVWSQSGRQACAPLPPPCPHQSRAVPPALCTRSASCLPARQPVCETASLHCWRNCGSWEQV